MEADSVQRDDKEDCIVDMSNENSTPPGSPDVNNVFGEPVLIPRVGDKYQVDIPSILTEPERLEFLANPLNARAPNASLAFLVGLSVPLTWVCDEENSTNDGGLVSLKKLKGTANANRSSEARNGKKGQAWSRKKSSELNVDEHGDESKLVNVEPMLAAETGFAQSNGAKNYNPVPGLTTEPWNDEEVDSFLLGLYIFGKNFTQIATFMEKNDLGAIQSFYYGKFYRSDAYRRWSRSRKKVRRKKCVIGRKIFSGWRQQELLSRLSSRISEEPHKSLLEGYKLFTEGQTSFEDYIFLLKSTVGVPVLVEVIGIDKGKEDLTSIELDIGRTNHDIGSHLPTGQDCSSLSSKEILNLLTGGFRLSKGRCSDIFWDAVWPRLLAKGWHSEQPKNQGYVSSKNYLVFLMPGIKKFSRRKLAKGEHYFDSVSDVLNKVASEPKLIELESEESSVGGLNGQDGWSPETGSEQDDQSGSRRHCYLKPRVSTSNSCQIKFTVVDTSLVYGGKSSSIRELRYLPVEFKITSAMANGLVDDEEDSSDDNLNEFRSFEKPDLQGDKARRLKGVSDSGGSNCMKFTVVDTSVVLGGKPSKVRELRCLPLVAKEVSGLTGFLKKNVTLGDSLLGKQERESSEVVLKSKKKSSKSSSQNDIPDSSSKNQSTAKNLDKTEVQQDQNTSVSGEKRTVLQQFKRRAKPGNSDSLAPVVKRRRLTACAKAKMSDLSQNHSQGSLSGSKQQMDVNDVTFKSEPNLDENIKLKILLRNCSSSPQMAGPSCHSIVTEAREPVAVEEKEIISEAPMISVDVNTPELNTVVNRRQSTRNRPLTTRALEALANGFLNVQRRSKNNGVNSGENPFSNPCRKARSSKVKVVGPSHGDAAVVGSGDYDSKAGDCDDVKNEGISKAVGQAEGSLAHNGVLTSP